MQINKYYCDLCGSQVQYKTNLQAIQFMATDPILDYPKYDICIDCYKQLLKDFETLNKEASLAWKED